MQKETFSEFVWELSEHFEHKQPTKARARSWYERVKDLPDEILPWCSTKIKDTSDYFPRNLSKAILEFWEVWKRENPDKIKNETDAIGCSRCFRGWLPVQLGTETTAFRCGHCQSVTQDIATMATVEELEGYGWHVQKKSGQHSGAHYRELLKRRKIDLVKRIKENENF